jgi:O-antigen ligase
MRYWQRFLAWGLAIGCLYVVGLTVSRASLLAVVISLCVGYRKVLRRAFLPVLALLFSSWIIFALGLFDAAISKYEERGTTETGRLYVWPRIIERISESVLVGYGANEASTYESDSGQVRSPHNTFLYLAVTSGIVPFALFSLFWIRAFWSAMFGGNYSLRNRFGLPLLTFAFLTANAGDFGFMAPWGLLALSLGAAEMIRALADVHYPSAVRVPININVQSSRPVVRQKFR